MQLYVKDFGAVGDGKTNDAEAIQAALDACAYAGGGRVVLEGGHTYYSASIHLRPSVELHLEKGCILMASSRLEDYFNPNQGEKDKGVERIGTPVMLKPSYVFIYGKDAHELSITGEGKIDGNVWSFVKRIDRYYANGDFYPRPTMIYLEHCNHISIRQLTLQNAPFWTLHPAGCNDVLIEGIRILNPLDVANSDGIDPDHCSNVRILGCYIVCADDCICLKTTAGNGEYGPTSNVIISACTLTSTSAAIKIGTEGVGDFEHIRVSDCCISDSNRGISIQLRDGGNVRDLVFSNISINTRRFADCYWGCGEAIALTTLDRDEHTKSGSIQDVHFHNINCCGENGIFIAGNVDNWIRDISFDQLRVTLRSVSKWEKGKYDLRPTPHKDQSFLYSKSPGIWMNYVEGVRISNCKVTVEGEETEDFAGGIRLDHCNNVDGVEEI